MDLAQARQKLARSLQTAIDAPPGADRFREARQLLLASGAEAVGIDGAAAPGLEDLIPRAAVASPAGPARRAFAVLIVEALAVPGVLSFRSSQARLHRDIRALVESALPDLLLRAGYPFDGDAEAKQRSIARLHASIDEHLKPLEPSIPTWLSGRVQT